ncbi:hypothetical protein PanWU01x14_038980, partial [Parasponia andersonii]
AKKGLGDTNVREATEFIPPMEVIEPSLSPSNHQKPYKKDTRRWTTKKKRYGDHQFEPRLKGMLGSSCLKLF